MHLHAARLAAPALRWDGLEGELRIARLRAVGAVALAVCFLAGYIKPEWTGLRVYPPAAALLFTLWSGAALAFWAALRRGWYRPWLWLAVPLADALVLAGIFALIWRYLDFWGGSIPRGTVVTTAMLCVPLALSGVLRPTRRGAILSAGLALMVFGFVASVARLHAIYIAAALATLALASGLAMEIASAARQVPRQAGTPRHDA
jgi:hypothetical protein